MAADHPYRAAATAPTDPLECIALELQRAWALTWARYPRPAHAYTDGPWSIDDARVGELMATLVPALLDELRATRARLDAAEDELRRLRSLVVPLEREVRGGR